MAKAFLFIGLLLALLFSSYIYGQDNPTVCKPIPTSQRPEGTLLPTYVVRALRWQKESPAHIVAVNLSRVNFVNGLLIFNSSESDVMEIQIGTVINGYIEEQPIRKILVSVPISVFIASGAVEAVGSQWKASEVLDQVKDFERFTAKVGLVSVKLKNGRSYKYDLASLSDFVDQPDRQIEKLFGKFDQDGLLDELVKKGYQEPQSQTIVLEPNFFDKEGEN